MTKRHTRRVCVAGTSVFAALFVALTSDSHRKVGSLTHAEALTPDVIEGKHVWLERQATDRDADGVLLRDVWIADGNGDRALVAARLLETGAGTPAPTPPDTRYQAWLQAAAALARTNGAGLWGACGDAST